MSKYNKKNRNWINKLVTINILIGFIIISLFSNATLVGAVQADVEGDTSTASSTNQAWREWKQIKGDWADRIYLPQGYGDYKFGDKVGESNKSNNWGTVADWGCYLLSLSIQIARSGTATKKDFDPWDFIEHMSKSGYINSGGEITNVAPGVSKFTDDKFRAKDVTSKLGDTSEKGVAEAVETAIKAGLYPIARISYTKGGTHFVAIDGVKDGKILMLDPASDETDLYKKYGNRDDAVIDQIRTFESDIPFEKANGTTDVTVTEEDKETIKINLMKWDEGAIPGMPKPVEWFEEPVPFVNYMDLEIEERDSIEKWKQEVKTDKNTTIVKINRVIVMFFGISLILLSLVFLVAYVFDRVTITEFRALEALTRDRLTASATGESTFFKGSTGYPKLVNGRDLIMIEFLMIGASVLILNGGIFTVINWTMNLFKFILELFGF